MGAAPPAGQLQIKRLSTSASAPHTPYAYIVAPEDMAVNSPTTLFHEFGHSVRHVADGAHTHWDYDNFRFVYARGHDGGQVTNKGFVFNEGWANYWEAVVIGIPVPVHPGAPTTDASFVDFNEDLVVRRDYAAQLNSHRVRTAAELFVQYHADARGRRVPPGRWH